MLTLRRAAILIGAFFWISDLSVLVGSAVSGPILNSSNYLALVYPNRGQVVTGELVAMINDVAIIGYGIVLYIVLRKHNEALSLGYLAAKIVEAVALVAGTASILTLTTLSQRFLQAGSPKDSYFQTVAAMAVSGQSWASQLSAIFYILGALILMFLLYQSRVVPRFIPIWGVIALASLTTGLALGIPDPTHGFQPGQLLVVLIILWELFFATRVIVKGFDTA